MTQSKQKMNCNYWIGIVLVIMIMIASTSFIYYKMPKKYCETIEHIEKIEVQAPNYTYILAAGWEPIPENAVEVICEDGIYENWGSVETYSKEPKVCMVKIAEEVCEIR